MIKKKEAIMKFLHYRILSRRGDSNARPPRPERGALPTALLLAILRQRYCFFLIPPNIFRNLPPCSLYPLLLMRAHARTLLYTHAYHLSLITYHSYFITHTWRIVDYQSLTKKMMFYNTFFAKKFGQFAKKQYLCTRFAPEMSESRKWQKSH